MLGNCIYDKDYLAKVTRLKVAPVCFDFPKPSTSANGNRVNGMQRTCIVTQTMLLQKKRPYRRKRHRTRWNFLHDQSSIIIGKRPHHMRHLHLMEMLSLEVSILITILMTVKIKSNQILGDVFDEADFVANTVGNPDEVVLDVDTPQPIQRLQARPQVPPVQQRSQGYQQRAAPPNPAMATPSKPERQWNGPAPTTNAAFNNNPNQNAVAQRGGLAGHSQGMNQTNGIGNDRSSQEFQRSNDPTAGIVKTEQPANASNTMGNQPTTNNNVPAEPAVGFYSARAVDILRDNPRASPMAPKFDPHAESPSIRKTAGIDHTKSVPVSKPMLFGTSQSPAGPAAAAPGAAPGRNFINPATDVHRRIGAPGGNPGGIASPVAKGFTTSSYRPLTRPAVDNRNAANNTNNPTNDPSLKRPPLNDVTNAPLPGALPGSGDIKRPRLSNEAPQHQQQPPQ